MIRQTFHTTWAHRFKPSAEHFASAADGVTTPRGTPVLRSICAPKRLLFDLSDVASAWDSATAQVGFCAGFDDRPPSGGRNIQKQDVISVA